VLKNRAASAGDVGDAGSIPGVGRSPGGEHDNPPQYSCLENPMNRGTWWATVHGVAEHRTRLSDLAHTHRTVRTLKSASRKPQTLAFFFFFPLRRCKNRVVKDEFCDSGL